MSLLRKLLFPLAFLYGWITQCRNILFDIKLLKSYSFDIPIIAVGNLSVGGTGKTPQIEYLIRLLSPDYKIATLSRGYKRKSKGFILANENSNASILGDEPFQYFNKFKSIQVTVDADRKHGITQLLNLPDKPDVILLDDAYQHRKVTAGLYILLTSYGDLYMDDFMLPTGNLREKRKGAVRATSIIVTKCPKDLSQEEQYKIRLKLKLQPKQSLFFSFIDYDTMVFADKQKLAIEAIKKQPKLLLAGIAKPKSFIDYLKQEGDDVWLFADHHDFTNQELYEIDRKTQNKIIITTEKDYVRLKDSILKSKLFYLPIKSRFITNGAAFDTMIKDYINKA